MILWLLIVVLVLWTALFRFRRRRLYALAAKLPHPKDELPIIGVAHKLSGNTEDIMTTLTRYTYEAMDTNGIIRIWLNHILYVVHIWRYRRKILMPVFSPKIIESFIEIFSEQSQILTQRLSSMCGSAFNIWPFICAYGLDSLSETALGIKGTVQRNLNSSFLRSLEFMMNIVGERIMHLWLQPDWLFKLFPQYPKYQQCMQTLHGRVDEIILKKKAEPRNQIESLTEADFEYDLKNYQRKCFLDLLICLSSTEKSYTDLELREEILTLMIAGTDTSAIAISFTLILLGKYPQVQEQVYEEIREVLGNSDRLLVKEDVVKLNYLERVIKESLRLFPPIPIIVRKVEADINLPSGLTLPAGSGVAVSIYGCHRDPKYWGPDAEHFDPDRFLPERFNLKHPCSYIPFNSGPRNCVGFLYALTSIKIVLATIIRRYKIIGEPETSPIPNIRVKLDIMMKAAKDYQVNLETRPISRMAKCKPEISNQLNH